MKKFLKMSLISLAIIILGVLSMGKIYLFRDDIILEQKLIQGEQPNKENIQMKFTLNSPANSAKWDAKLGLHQDAKLISSYYNKDTVHQTKAIELSRDFVELGGNGISFNINDLRSYRGKNEKDILLNLLNKHRFFRTKLENSIFSEMIKNDKKEDIIRLRDYTEYFPLCLYSNDPLINTAFEIPIDNNHHSVFYDNVQRIDDYFQFPIKDDMKIKCTLSYKFRDNSVQINTEADSVAPYHTKIPFDLLSIWDEENERIILSFKGSKEYEIPLEYQGIYVLPITKGKELDKDSYEYHFDTSKIKKVYTVKEGESIEKVFKDGKDKLCVISRKNKGYSLHVLDYQNFENIKSTDLKSQAKILANANSFTNGIFVLYEKGDFTWLDNKNYEVLLTSKIDKKSSKQLHNWDLKDVADFLYQENSLYLLENHFGKVFLKTLTKEGTESIIEYKFPLSYTLPELSDKNSRLSSAFSTSKAEFIEW